MVYLSITGRFWVNWPRRRDGGGKLPLIPGSIDGFLFSSTASYGKADYTKATKKACVYCHVDPQKAPKELKEPGKYYEQHKTLDGYKEAR